MITEACHEWREERLDCVDCADCLVTEYLSFTAWVRCCARAGCTDWCLPHCDRQSSLPAHGDVIRECKQEVGPGFLVSAKEEWWKEGK